MFISLLGQISCAETNYYKIYEDMQPADFSYQHGVDPEQYYDMEHTTWSPYPLFRLNSALIFKNITIEPGYYLLTPRKHKDSWYMLFKDNGKVRYIIPIYERDYVPEMFYENNLPKEKLTFSQKAHINLLNFVGKIAPSSKRKEAPKTYLEINDIDKNFVQIVVYWGDFRYYTLFKTSGF